MDQKRKKFWQDGVLLLAFFVFLGIGLVLLSQSSTMVFRQLDEADNQTLVMEYEALKGDGQVMLVTSEKENFTVYKLVENREEFVLTGSPVVGGENNSTVFSAALNSELDAVYIFSMNVNVYSSNFPLIKSDSRLQNSKQNEAVLFILVAAFALLVFGYRNIHKFGGEKRVV